MRGLGNLIRYIILGVNIFFVLLYLAGAFSPLLNPEKFPVFSCMSLTFPVFLFINCCFIVFWFIFYKKYCLLSCIALFITVGDIRTYFPVNIRTKNVPSTSIKLLSYNVMGFDGSKKHTKDSPNSIMQYILDSQADIICLQEFIMGKQKDKIKKEEVDAILKEYPYKAYHKIGTGENGVACYSKFPILSSRKLNYESMYNGSALYEILVDGDTLTIINNHLESNKLTYEDKATYVDMIKSPEKEKVSNGIRVLVTKLAEAYAIRAKQAGYLSEVIAERKDKTLIVCGDFNDTPVSYTHRMLAKDLDDAFVQSGNGLGVSYNQNGFYFRIDHILISKNLKSFNCTVDRSIKTSDHYPIWCYIDRR